MLGNLKLITLFIILGAGIAAQKTGIIDIGGLLGRLEYLSESWWLPPAAILIQLVMYTFAFPGSIIMWTIGAIYEPWAATVLVVIGGAAGSVMAYFFSLNMASSWGPRFENKKVFKIMKNNSGFAQLCALRCLPGFPHSFINYSAGILKVGLLPFIVSTVIGFTLKGFIYCSAIYSALHLEDEQVITISTLWPLIALVIFSLVGVVIQKKFFA